MSEKPSIVALIPARAGSKRIKNKNIQPLAGHPLIAYSIAAAAASKIFTDIIVSTDSEKYASVGRHYGAEVPFKRPVEFAGEVSPDIEWVEFTLKKLKISGRSYDCFSILRPTSPFRTGETIKRAWDAFMKESCVDSLRAVEKCKQHPGKMWVIRGKRMVPLLPLGPAHQPWHSSQYPSLPEIHVQNASLEIAWSRVVFETRTIAGHVLMPFFMEGYEGFDINTPYDWDLAEHLVRNRKAILPKVKVKPYGFA